MSVRELDVEEIDFVGEHRALQLAIPGMDGYKSDKLTVSLSGSLDKTSADDLEVLGELKMGQLVNLRVQAVVARKGFALAAGDNPESLSYGVNLRVQSLEIA